ncbi:hypothetical protein V8C35DRAFT_67391 [Trichoderma chlorosporum]
MSTVSPDFEASRQRFVRDLTKDLGESGLHEAIVVYHSGRYDFKEKCHVFDASQCLEMFNKRGDSSEQAAAIAQIDEAQLEEMYRVHHEVVEPLVKRFLETDTTDQDKWECDTRPHPLGSDEAGLDLGDRSIRFRKAFYHYQYACDMFSRYPLHTPAPPDKPETPEAKARAKAAKAKAPPKAKVSRAEAAKARAAKAEAAKAEAAEAEAANPEDAKAKDPKRETYSPNMETMLNFLVSCSSAERRDLLKAVSWITLQYDELLSSGRKACISDKGNGPPHEDHLLLPMLLPWGLDHLQTSLTKKFDTKKMWEVDRHYFLTFDIKKVRWEFLHEAYIRLHLYLADNDRISHGCF